jgi:hypothetical protein
MDSIICLVYLFDLSVNISILTLCENNMMVKIELDSISFAFLLFVPHPIVSLTNLWICGMHYSTLCYVTWKPYLYHHEAI